MSRYGNIDPLQINPEGIHCSNIIILFFNYQWKIITDPLYQLHVTNFKKKYGGSICKILAHPHFCKLISCKLIFRHDCQNSPLC